jgi:hypothetical protein
VYLYKMPGAGKRVRVVINWMLDRAFGAEVVAELRAVRPAPPPSAASEAKPATGDPLHEAGEGD